LGIDIVANGGAESSAAARDFQSAAPLDADVDGWNVVLGRLTPVAYDIGTDIHPNTALAARIGGGNNYFAGGPGGPSPAIAQQSIFLNEHIPLHQIRTGRVRATLSAHLGGFAAQADEAKVIALFRDELLNDVGTLVVGPVSPHDRGPVTDLLLRWASMAVPAEAVTVEVRIVSHRLIGLYNDGFVDNVALHLDDLDCPDDDW
jgi:hypothetical protein